VANSWQFATRFDDILKVYF